MTFNPLRLLPDSELVVRDILLVSGVAVGVNVPSDLLQRLPYISARRFGGSAVHPKFLDRGTFLIDCWSNNRATAAAMGETCRVLLFNAWRSQAAHAGATIAHYTEVTAPSELRTDGQAGGLYRFSSTVSLHVRPSH
ncbi:MAG: hypothetical protein JWM93_95 [Frankiales bacterium]|nr:hypothetical protein [Frankiales bacterium]